jgi:Putative inner membrane protein (DUF1819)
MLRSGRGESPVDETSNHALGATLAGAGEVTPIQKAGPRYRADITAGSLKVAESRRIAGLLLHEVDAIGWADAIVKRNVLQARNPATARRLAKLIRARLESMGPDLWTLVRDGKGSVATHAMFAAAVKHSPLLGDFLGMVVADQYRRFGKTISNKMFSDYLDGCRERDPLMPAWTEKTRLRVRSSVFQMLAQAGYIESTRSLKLQSVHIADQVVRCLNANREDFRCRLGHAQRCDREVC